MHELHNAVDAGSVERTLAELSKGAVDIDEHNLDGFNPLMCAASLGNSRIEILLHKGAMVSAANDAGATALHMSAQEGHLDVVKLLVKAGADLEAKDSTAGVTPLVLAAQGGHSEVVRVLIEASANLNNRTFGGLTPMHMSAEHGHLAITKLLVKAGADLGSKASAAGSAPLHQAAQHGHSKVAKVLVEAGANPNSRLVDGTTPLYLAAQNGHVDTVKVLPCADANPMLASGSQSGPTYTPLVVASENGHSEVVHELIREHGIESCGGARGGVDALRFAAFNQRVDIMELLTSAGVVDAGITLLTAANLARESIVMFLLQQLKRSTSCERAGYLETCYRNGTTPMLYSIEACSPRITRMLVDAGADTTTAVRVMAADGSGRVVFHGTPLAFTCSLLAGKVLKEKDATESQLHSLEATRRLLMRVEAAHAVSWLWASDPPSTTHSATEGSDGATRPTPLISMLPILRRRARSPGVLVAALLRHSKKP